MKAQLRQADDEADVASRIFSFEFGMQVRALLGLWGKNPELMAAVPHYDRRPDDASRFIVLECWRSLRRSTP